jgi:hypothetical protein
VRVSWEAPTLPRSPEPRIAASVAGKASECGDRAGQQRLSQEGHAHQALHLLLVQGAWSLLRHGATGELRAEVRRRRDKGELVTGTQGQLTAIFPVGSCGGSEGGRSAAGAGMCRIGGSTRVVHHYRDGGTCIGEVPVQFGSFYWGYLGLKSRTDRRPKAGKRPTRQINLADAGIWRERKVFATAIGCLYVSLLFVCLGGQCHCKRLGERSSMGNESDGSCSVKKDPWIWSSPLLSENLEW